MKLEQIMTTEVEVIRPDASLFEAAKLMKDIDVGPLPVCDGERIVGMITDRDIVVRALANEQDPGATRVADVMTPGITWCYADEPIEEGARLMKEKQIRRLPLMNRDKRLVGIVSLGDIAVHTGNELLAGEVVEKVSEPGMRKAG